MRGIINKIVWGFARKVRKTTIASSVEDNAMQLGDE